MASRTTAALSSLPALLRSRRAWVLAGAVLLTAAAAIVGFLVHAASGEDAQPSARSATGLGSGLDRLPTIDPTPRPPRHRVGDWRDAAGEPVRLAIPALDVRAKVVGIPAPDGVLSPPADPSMLGWWNAGAVAGAAHGNALITGHTVHTGGGAFDDIASLQRGDHLRVTTVNGRIRYVVRSVVVYSKAELEQRAAQIFRQSGPSRLALITCDDWNGTEYQSNAVVFATPV
jgi:LPXTG-site transpeptidase (sortase) family protein